MRQEDHLVLWEGLRGAAFAFPGSAACVSSPLHSWRVGLQHHPTLLVQKLPGRSRRSAQQSFKVTTIVLSKNMNLKLCSECHPGCVSVAPVTVSVTISISVSVSLSVTITVPVSPEGTLLLPFPASVPIRLFSA